MNWYDEEKFDAHHLHWGLQGLSEHTGHILLYNVMTLPITRDE